MTVSIVLAGPDEDGLAPALTAAGADVFQIEGIPTGEQLAAANVGHAEVYVLTDVEEATSIAVAKDQNPGIRAVVYSRDSLPEFARAQVDLVVDPALLEPNVVATELIAGESG